MSQNTNVTPKFTVSENILKSSEVLIKIRLWFFSLAYAHLVFMAIKLLSIDFREAEDSSLWVYHEYRWRLITSWFNMLSLVYTPICLYCDWRELKGGAGRRHVKILSQIRLMCFSSILLPTTVFADSVFWLLWNKDRELLVPMSVDAIVPVWNQHSLHTISLIVVLLDLILVPRSRPKSLIPGFIVMNMFFGSYIYVFLSSVLRGEYLYPVLKLLNIPKIIFWIAVSLFVHYLLYTIQWAVIDIIWGNRNDKSVKKNGYASYFAKFSSDVLQKLA